MGQVPSVPKRNFCVRKWTTRFKVTVIDFLAFYKTVQSLFNPPTSKGD